MKLIILFCLTTRVLAEMRSMQHSMYVSRKSRSNSAPTETGYVYSRVNSDPGEYTTFGNSASDHTSYYSDRPVTKYSDTILDKIGTYDAPSSSMREYIHRPIEPIMSITKAPLSRYDLDYTIAKANSKYESKYLPSKIKTDAMYEKLKSVMHYVPPPEVDMSNMATGFGGSNEYNIDDDDIRTNSRSSNLGWPYFYHNPYEYEAMKIDSEIGKAKDKRYAVDAVKPVYESVDDDFPVVYEAPLPTPRYYRDASTDNPIAGDEPFFSFVLNDYFDKNNQDDPLAFKGFDWGKDFDHGTESKDYDYVNRNRRLGSNFNSPEDSPVTVINNSHHNNYNQDVSKAAQGDSVTEKGYNKKHEFDNHEKGDEQKENHKTGYEQSSQKYNGFKDFIDTFANKFGNEDHKTDSKYVLKRNQDKGEKKKGFRRVYHKDEYQEDNEFYDNTNNKAESEEKGSSNAHHGGSQGLLQSHAVAASGNEGNAFAKAGNTESKLFEDNHKGHATDKGSENYFNTYRDVAKKAALSNNADYTDH